MEIPVARKPLSAQNTLRYKGFEVRTEFSNLAFGNFVPSVSWASSKCHPAHIILRSVTGENLLNMYFQ